MTAGRAVVGKKVCRRKMKTDKKLSMHACKKEAIAGRKQHTHEERRKT
jgi:hypothetical protein